MDVPVWSWVGRSGLGGGSRIPRGVGWTEKRCGRWRRGCPRKEQNQESWVLRPSERSVLRKRDGRCGGRSGKVRPDHWTQQCRGRADLVKCSWG